MLNRLAVKNIALIDQCALDFDAGLNVFSGETGAGKSLIVDAVSLLMGGKADRSLIRAGADKAYVEGLFSLTDCPQAKEILKLNELDAGDEVLLSREITSSGRNTCRVDGVPLSLTAYQGLTETLLDLHGQHAHQSLLNDRTHLNYLDGYGDEKHQLTLRQVQEAYEKWHACEKTLNDLRQKEAEKEERQMLLGMRLKELEALDPKPGEESQLQQERDRFRGSEKLTSHTAAADDDLSEGLARLKSAMGALEKAAQVDPDLEGLSGRLSDLYYEAEDVSLEVSRFREGLQFDPEREEEVLRRLDMIRRLCRKYRVDADDLPGLLEDTREELRGLDALSGDLVDAEAAEKKARARYDARAGELSRSREDLAKRFAAAVEKQLKDLNMASCRFTAALIRGRPQRTGDETAVFMIAANAGEEMHSLSRTASGGELSRIMLAIKAAAAMKTGVNSMVFDEIDTGISGRAAQAAAEKMALIARSRQVLCVTHLQQIAAMADHQYYVEKYERDGRSYSRARLLTPEERAGEIARMLGGEESSALKHAGEMLSAADKYKKSL